MRSFFSGAVYFNSRPHKEVDGESFWWFIECINISTHDLTRRSTECVWLNFWRRRYFNSRPHKEVDNRPSVPVFTSKIFQLTTSQGGRLLLRQRKQTMHTYFNSRPHKEVDFYFCNSITVIVPFQLTTSQGGRLPWQNKKHIMKLFQLTTSQGGRHPGKIFTFYILYFNSRPHKEVDIAYENSCHSFSISTHDLTRRSTHVVVSISATACISTHDLTRRSTCQNHSILQL